MKKIIVYVCLFTTVFASCGGPYYQPSVGLAPSAQVVQQPIQSGVDPYYSPYQIETDGYGNQMVYYTDPSLHASYYIQMSLFNQLMAGGLGYIALHNYYVGHRSYMDGYYNTYHRTYTHVYYNSASDGGRRFYNRPYRSSVPTGGSAGYRSSIPNGRTAASRPGPSVPTGARVVSPSSSPNYRASVPSARPSASYRSSAPSRSSVPSGRH